MEFKVFANLLNEHINLLSKEKKLFVVDTNKDDLWEFYLNSFPKGTNKIFRERREYDCTVCKQFIRGFGNVVAIINEHVVSIWDITIDDPTYQTVAQKMGEYVRSFPISDVFASQEPRYGLKETYENSTQITTWNHFYTNVPAWSMCPKDKSVGAVQGEKRDSKNVLQRSLEEITEESVEIVLDLIAQNSIYKGEEWKAVLLQFQAIQKEYQESKNKDLFCWVKSLNVSGAISRLRNHSMGTLLVDISADTDLEIAIKKYEKIVAPTNYKRPKAIASKRMIEDAQKTVEELGLMSALKRRFAKLSDISVQNILFCNRDAAKELQGNIFDMLKSSIPKKYDHVEEISIKDFVNNILPSVTNLEVYLENKHSGNLVSLIAQENMEAGNLFKWNNGFSWAYSGNITDSIKQEVKSQGGNVDGVLRFSIQWNENEDNEDDLDAHCIEPNNNHIYFRNKNNRETSGQLDIDIINPNGKVAVENITWTDKYRMKEGIYKFYVHNYTSRSGKSGFNAEIEFDGELYSFAYNTPLRAGEEIQVAEVTYSKSKGFSIVEKLPSSLSNRTLWGIETNKFYPVSVCMYSPNYWDGQNGIGNKHYFFMIGCKNPEKPNGFFNEYLREDLSKHKRVFEILGNTMRVEDNDGQLSGLGFSSTQKNTLVVKVTSSVERVLRIKF